jgi:hypothetical protein
VVNAPVKLEGITTRWCSMYFLLFSITYFYKVIYKLIRYFFKNIHYTHIFFKSAQNIHGSNIKIFNNV